MNRKGFAPILILVAIVVVLAVAGGVWYYESHQSRTSMTIPPTENSDWSQMARTYLLSNGIIHSDTVLISDVNDFGGGNGAISVFFPSSLQPASGTTYDNWILLINKQNNITVNQSSTALVEEGAPECIYYHIQTEAQAVAAIQAVYPQGPAQAWPEAANDSYTTNAPNGKPIYSPCYWLATDSQGYVYEVNDEGTVTRGLHPTPQ